MNQVFITRSGERAARWKRQTHDLGPIGAHLLSAGIGGGALALVLGVTGGAVRRIDGSVHQSVYFGVLAAAAIPVIWLQARGKMGGLPERREQVPRRWLGWGRKWWTAAAYGAVLGAGVFTHLRYAAMYVLGIAVLGAPSAWTAIAVGAVYGMTRGANVVYAWWTRKIMPSRNFFGRRPLALAVTASAVPIWLLFVSI